MMEEFLFHFVPQYAEYWLYEEGKQLRLRWFGAQASLKKNPIAHKRI